MISPRACDDIAECQLRVTSAPVYRLSTCDIVYTITKRQLTIGTRMYVWTTAMYTSHYSNITQYQYLLYDIL